MRRRAALGALGWLATAGGAKASCVAYPEETDGPFPADGSNSARGQRVNILEQSGIVRDDLRASFGASKTVAAGVPLALTMKLLDAGRGCSPLVGHAVYLWHCDRAGAYSIYNLPDENYLRGVVITDANGEASFSSIFPGCYGGRYPHIHLEVYASRDALTSHRNVLLTSQIALPDEACAAVYNGAPEYAGSIRTFRRLTLASDGIFGDNTPAENAAMTATLSGDVARGYRGNVVIGMAR